MSSTTVEEDPLLESHIKILLSGGAENTDLSLSKGGVVSGTELINNVPLNLFDKITTDEAVNGITDHRCLYIKNTHSTKTALKCRLFIESNTTSAATEVFFGIGSSGINKDETTLQQDTNDPPAVIFTKISEVPTVANIGDLPPNSRIGIWIKWVTNAGAETIPDDICIFALDFDQEASNLPPPVGQCPEGYHFDVDLGLCVSDDDPDPNDPICPNGFHWDDLQQKCIANTPLCPTGFKFDPVLQTCVPDSQPVQCPSGSHYDLELQQCVPDNPPSNPPPDISIALVGDFDCNSRTDATFANIKSHIKTQASQGLPLGALIALGDLSYGNSQDCWIELTTTLDDLYPINIFPMIGNHDDTEDGNAQKREDIINTYPVIPESGNYAVTIGNIRFIVIDTQKDYDVGSAQYNFTQQQLELAHNNADIKWKIVCYHKPSLHAEGDNHGALVDLRDAYHPLFDQYKVDFIFSGHNHIFWRSFPIKHNANDSGNPTVVNTDPDGPYNNVDGRTFIVVGTGGRTAHDSSLDSWIIKMNATYGVGYIHLENQGRRIKWEFITNEGETIDSAEFNK